MNSRNPVQKAIAALGGQAAAARRLDVSPGLTYQWWHGLRPVSPKHCARLEVEAGIPCEQLRHDVMFMRDATGRVVGWGKPVHH